MQEELGCSLYLPHFVYGMSKLYKVLFKYCLCKFGYLEARYPLGPGEGGGYTWKNWAGCAAHFPKPLPYLTKICDIPYPFYHLTINSKPYL